MNLVVLPYKTEHGIWAFDHDHNSTVEEGLLNGTEVVIDRYFETLTGEPPEVGSQMKFTLDTEPFPEATTALDIVSTSETGTFYVDRLTEMSVWLCPWLQGFFGHVPETIYVRPELIEGN